MVPVAPGLTVLAAVESPEAPAEVVFGWFWAFSSSRGSSSRPRNKEVVVVLVWAVVVCLVVFCFCPDRDMVES